LGAEELEPGVWKWDGGTSVDSNYFSEGEPNNSGDCLQVFELSGHPGFYDVDCTYHQHYASERNIK